jgi:hypothetical protein
MVLLSSGQKALASTYQTTPSHFPEDILHGHRIKSSHISRNTHIIFNLPSRIVLSLSNPIVEVKISALKSIIYLRTVLF